MKSPRTFALLSSIGLPLLLLPTGHGFAQIPVTVTSDLQGALSYIQDATNQVQNLQQWASQYGQMAQQIRQYGTQVQQYSDMLQRSGDPSKILHVTGLDGVTRSVNGLSLQYQGLGGNLSGMGYQFQGLGSGGGSSTAYGDPRAWSNAAGRYSVQHSNSGESLQQVYQGKLVDSNYAGYAATEKAFDSYVKSAYDARKEAAGDLSEITRLTKNLETAPDAATVAKVSGALQAKQAVADANARVEEKAARDVMVADTMRRLEAEKQAQAEREAIAISAEEIAQKVRAEQAANLKERAKTRLKSVGVGGIGGMKTSTPVGIQ